MWAAGTISRKHRRLTIVYLLGTSCVQPNLPTTLLFFFHSSTIAFAAILCAPFLCTVSHHHHHQLPPHPYRLRCTAPRSLATTRAPRGLSFVDSSSTLTHARPNRIATDVESRDQHRRCLHLGLRKRIAMFTRRGAQSYRIYIDLQIVAETSAR